MIFGKFDERGMAMPRPVEARPELRKSGATAAAAVPDTAKSD
jgi:hypothetical protein